MNTGSSVPETVDMSANAATPDRSGIVPPNQPAASGRPPATCEDPAGAASKQLKVFLVEDNFDVRFLLAQQLEAHGFEVRTTGTMQAALSDFPLSGSRVLLTDIDLPDGDGGELLHQLRHAGCAPFAIAMSGYGAACDIAAGHKKGFRHYLVKPFDFDTLGKLLAAARTEVEKTQSLAQ